MPGPKLWAKLAAATVIVGIGGPALVYRLVPTEEELFSRYNPELQKRSLENRNKTEQDFDDFVNRLKKYSKSDKPIWMEMDAAENRKKSESFALQKQKAALEESEKQRRRDEIKKALDQ